MQYIYRIFIFITICLCSASTYGQQKELCIWGLEYGSSLQEVKEKIKEDKGLTPDPELSSDVSLVYTDNSYLGEKAEYIKFDFIDNRLNGGFVFIYPDAVSRIFTIYNKLKLQLNNIYGKPINKQKTYIEVTPDIIDAMDDDRIAIYDRWELKSNKSIINNIQLHIDNEIRCIVLQYVNPTIKLPVPKDIETAFDTTVWGISLGMSRQEVINIAWEQHKYCKSNTDTEITYRNYTFEGIQTDAVTFLFKKGKLYEVNLFITSTSIPSFLDTLEKIRNSFVERYGEPEFELFDTISSHDKGDGYGIKAIRSQKYKRYQLCSFYISWQNRTKKKSPKIKLMTWGFRNNEMHTSITYNL